MSWNQVSAAWKILNLTPSQKFTLLALSDQADAAGNVVASNLELQRLTSQSEQTVRRALKQLQALKRVEQVQAGDGRVRARFRLHLTGATVVGVPPRQGFQTSDRGVPNPILSTDPLLIPTSRKAEAPRRLEIPTRDQVTKLVHVLIEDDGVEIGDDGDLRELVKRACVRADFVYDRAVVDDGIMRALAARGHDPNHPLDLKRLRQPRRAR